MSGEFKHIPIMAKEIVEYLIPDANKSYKLIDGTLGYAGHSSLFLEKNPNLQLLGIDRDVDALKSSSERLAFASDRVFLKRGDYSQLADFAEEIGWNSVDAILLDIGISSPQIDNPNRGFAHRFDGPLDMRMDRRNSLTASRVVNLYDREQLFSVFKEYGEIKHPRKLVEEILKMRKIAPLTKTSELRDICETVFGKGKRGQLPVATLCFQALRIEVNSELEQLRKGLEEGLKLLAVGGRFAVITFHSLEDRIVKQFFKEHSLDCICPPGLPVCVCDHKADLKLLSRKPFTASKGEVSENSRSACAKLRIIEKIREKGE
jgi:16S rRNA (cytosine1402-N4)-methyltransferase